MSWFQRCIDSIREKRDARAFTPTGILHRAEANLERGAMVSEGFMGNDTRRVLHILRDDEFEFRELGLHWDDVAAQLDELLHKGSEGLGDPITVNGRYLVRVAETRGSFACPWEDSFVRKRSATVRRLEDGVPTGPELLFGDMSIHLLKDHHFLQGRGSPFRIEPKVLKEILREVPEGTPKA